MITAYRPRQQYRRLSALPASLPCAAPLYLFAAGGSFGESNRRLRCHVLETIIPPGEPQGNARG